MIKLLKEILPSTDNIIRLIDTTIWPFVVLIIFFVLKKPLKALVPFIESIKYKDFEIKIKSDLYMIKENVEATGIEVETDINAMDEINKLLEVSPSSAILESWKNLEVTAREKVKKLAPDGESFKNLLQRPIAYLEHTGALTPSTARSIHELKQLRNEIAHTAKSKIAKEIAIDYILLSEAISKQIEAIRELPKVKLTALTILVLLLNSLIDSGEYNHITIDQVHKEIEGKRILPFLMEETKGKGDFSLYGSNGLYKGFADYYHEQMYQIYEGYAGNERRKWGVEKLGLSLLLAWTNEIIQSGSGWHPD